MSCPGTKRVAVTADLLTPHASVKRLLGSRRAHNAAIRDSRPGSSIRNVALAKAAAGAFRDYRFGGVRMCLWSVPPMAIGRANAEPV